MLKIGVYGASPYNGNKGVVALSYSTILLLDKVLKEKGIDYSLYLIHGNKIYNKEEFIELMNYRIPFKSIEPINIGSFRSIIRFMISPKQIKSIFPYLSFDLILNMGGGDSFSDIYGTRRFYSINSQYIFARIFRKRIIVLPQTIGPFQNKAIEKKAKRSLNTSEVIMVRDRRSYDITKELTKRKVVELLDMAFFLPFSRQLFDNSYIHVGLNVSSLCWEGGYTRDNQFNLVTDYKKLNYQIIDYFLNQPKVKIHIVPHVVHEYPDIENDYQISLNLIEEYKNPNLVCAPFFLNPINAKNYISGLDFFIGARMHSTIASFSSGVPTVPLSYSRKFEGLYKDTLNYDVIGDMKSMSNSEILELISNSYKQRKDINLNIESILNGLVKSRKEKLIETFHKIFDR